MASVWSDERRRAAAERSKARWEDPSYRDRVGQSIGQSLAGRSVGDDTRRKIRESNQSRGEFKAQLAREGWSDERRQRHSERMRELWADPEFRERTSKAVSSALKGHPVSVATRRKIQFSNTTTAASPRAVLDRMRSPGQKILDEVRRSGGPMSLDDAYRLLGGRTSSSVARSRVDAYRAMADESLDNARRLAATPKWDEVLGNA